MYSAAISSLDSIVQLQTTTQTETFKLPPHAHVRVVTCETLDEVPSFLAHGSSPMAISRACLPPFRSRPPDENQILAAMVICRAYKRYRSRHRSESTFIQKLRDHSYDICLDAAKTMTGPYRHYRLLFLGCVPHLLVGLECMDLHATRVIDDQQEKLKQAEVKKLDATYANIAEARYVVNIFLMFAESNMISALPGSSSRM